MSCCASALDFSNSVPIVLPPTYTGHTSFLALWLLACCLHGLLCASCLCLWGSSTCHFSHLQLKAFFSNWAISLSDLIILPHLILIIQCCRHGVRTVRILSLILPKILLYIFFHCFSFKCKWRFWEGAWWVPHIRGRDALVSDFIFRTTMANHLRFVTLKCQEFIFCVCRRQKPIIKMSQTFIRYDIGNSIPFAWKTWWVLATLLFSHHLVTYVSTFWVSVPYSNSHLLYSQ